MPKEIYDPYLHGPERVQRSLLVIKRGYTEALRSKHTLPSTVARGLAALGIIIAGVGITYKAWPIVVDAGEAALARIIASDNEVFDRTGRMYNLDDYPVNPDPFPTQQPLSRDSYKDVQEEEIRGYLESILGRDFKLWKVDYPIFAQSMALNKEGNPVGHYSYSLPSLDPDNVVEGFSIDYGAEIPVEYLAIVPDGRGENNVWVIYFGVDPNTGNQKPMFVHDGGPSSGQSLGFRMQDSQIYETAPNLFGDQVLRKQPDY